jgi:hypothetical protein
MSLPPHLAPKFASLQEYEKEEPLSMSLVEWEVMLQEVCDDPAANAHERKIATLRIESLFARIQNETLSLGMYCELLGRQVARDVLLADYFDARGKPGDVATSVHLRERARRVQEYLDSPDCQQAEEET